MKLSDIQFRSLITDGTITIDGFDISLSVSPDTISREPWRECDGHGVIVEMVHQNQVPANAVILQNAISENGLVTYYDIDKTREIAKRDEWGVPNSSGMSPEQITEQAIQNDLKRIRGWFNDEWSYVMLTVIVSFDDDVYDTESYCGIESDHIENSKYNVELLVETALAEAKTKIVEKTNKLVKFVENVK